MKKTTILKTIVLAAAMMLGGSQAWAQTTLYYRTLTGTESDPADAAEQAWSASDKDGASADSWSGDISNITISESGLELRVDGASSKSITKSITTTANTKLTYDFIWGYPYNNSYSQDGAYTKITIGNNIEFINEKSNGSSYVINGTKTKYANTLNDTKVAIHLEVNTGTMMISNLTITKVSDSSVLLNKTSIPLNEETVFSSLSIGVKHTTNKTDGTRYTRTVFETIKVTETPQYAYSVHWKSGDTDMGEFTSGYDVNDASITIPYSRYLSTNHELYKISTANNTDVPTVSFTKTEDNQTEYMTGYTKQDVGYVVYCEEAENIDGMTIASPYTPNRCSGRKAAYCSDDITITSLPAGTYIVCIGMYGNASNQTFTVKAGETEVLNHEFTKSSTRGEATSDPFTINTTTDIKIKGGVSGTAFDNIYIVCTSGRVSAVDNIGYTFSSTLPLDFTGTTVEAYTAAYNSTSQKVELTRVYKVPANTGLFIKGTADDIPVLTGDADVIGTNNLVAVSAATTVETTSGENTNYVLALADKDDTSKGVLFLKAADTAVGAGKAYLQIPTDDAPEAPQLMLSFDDVIATGINTVHGAGLKVNGYYDLQGRKVMNPKKGLYIVNGKKVVIK